MISALLTSLVLASAPLPQEDAAPRPAQEQPLPPRPAKVTRQELGALVVEVDGLLAGPLIDGSLTGEALRRVNARFDRISMEFLGGQPEKVWDSFARWLAELDPEGPWRTRKSRPKAPLSRVRAALTRLLDEAEEAGAEIDEPSLRVLEARMELLVDAPSPESSREFLLSTPGLAREISVEARRVAAGERPYAMRAGDHWRTVAFGETDLPVRLYRPAGLEGQKPPLVVAFHGAGGDENFMFELAARGHIKTLADRHGFVVVCPATLDFMGNLEAFDALLEALRRDHGHDPERVFLLGHSMGTGPVAALSAARADRVARTVSIAGYGAGTADTPPALVLAGEFDPIVRPSRLRRAVDQALKRSAEVTYEVLPNQGHTLLLPSAMERAMKFFGFVD